MTRAPVELRHLRNFRFLAEELNFTRAARRAGMSQSALSEQIMRLEDVLGVPLFDRSQRQVRLTAAGETLTRELPELLDHVDQVVGRTRQAGGNVRTTLRIGYSAMSLNTPMSAIVQDFRRRRPDTEAVLREQSSSGSEKALMDGALDCIFMPNPPENTQLSYLTVSSDQVLCCMLKTNPLAAKPTLSIEDLRGAPLILPDQGSRYAAFILSAFARAGVEPRVIARCSRPSVFLTMASADAGVTFLPTSLKGMAPDDVALRPLGDPPLSAPFALVWNKTRQTPELEALIAAAHKALNT